MVNYGKIMTIIGAGLLIPGIVLISISPSYSGPSPLGISFLVGGIIGLMFGLGRWVQGANPLILGKIIRPKSAARSAWMWSLFIFNLTPFYVLNTRIFDYGPPFPFFIVTPSGNGNGSDMPYFLRPNSGYTWMPYLMAAFFIVWFVALFLIGKHPNFFRIFYNSLNALLLMFWVNFGIQMTLWSFLSDKTGIFLFKGFTSTNFMDLLPILLAISAYAIFSTAMVVRMLNQIYLGFISVDVKTNAQQAVIFIAIFAIFIGVVFPLYLGIEMCMQNAGYMYPFVQYIGIIYIAIILFKLVTSLLGSFREFSKLRVGEGSVSTEGNFGINTAFFLVIIFIAWTPLFLPLLDHGLNTKNFSIYNTDWNGSSKFAGDLENLGYNVMCVQSSFNVMTRLDPSKQIILISLGPNVFYNPASDVPFLLTELNGNFSMFLCDDQGTIQDLLFELFIASVGKTPLTFIPQGILHDNASYWKNSSFPVITQFADSPMTENIKKVCLDDGSALLGGPFITAFGWNLIGSTSSDYSFVDTNVSDTVGVFNASTDVYTLPGDFGSLLSGYSTGPIGQLGSLLSNGIPLGGYSQSVFVEKDLALNNATASGNATHSSRIFVGSDASWLDNQLTGEIDPTTGDLLFDNMQFGLNIVNYLACGRAPQDCIVVFDEAHIKPTLGYTELTAAAMFGVFQQYVNWLSTNPLLSLFYPLFALYSLSRWIPAEKNKKKVQIAELLEWERNLQKLKFRTSSFFSRKINWYRINKRYKQALILLYRRVERKINRIIHDQPITVSNIVAAITREKGHPLAKDVIVRLQKFFAKMIDLKANKDDVREEEEFQDLFLEMQWIADNI